MARFSYLRAEVMAELLIIDTVLDDLMEELEVPGKDRTKALMTLEQKRQAVERQAAHFTQSETSTWFGAQVNDVIAARLASLQFNLRDDPFFGTRKEVDLLEPVVLWLESKEHTAFDEVPMARKRIDVLGVKRGKSTTDSEVKLVGVELKNDLAQMKRGFDQLADFALYCHAVYLACTPRLAVEYLWAHAEAGTVLHWNANALDDKLRLAGFGLLLVEDHDVTEWIPAKDRLVADHQLRETLSQLDDEDL